MSELSFTSINSNECVGNSLSTINSNFLNTVGAITSLEVKLNSLSSSAIQSIVAGTNVSVTPVVAGVVTVNAINMDPQTLTQMQFVSAAENVGTSGIGLFKQKSNQRLAFKKLVSGGTNVVITDQGDTVKITAYDRTTSPGGEANTSSNAGTGFGLALPKSDTNLPFKSLVAGTNVSLVSSVDNITISASVSGSNTGTGAEVYTGYEQEKLKFKTLRSNSSNLTITPSNDNTELLLTVNEKTSAENLGILAEGYNPVGRVGLFKQKVGNILQIKSLQGDSQKTNANLSISPCDVKLEEDVFKNTVFLTVNDNITATNVGTAGIGIYKNKNKSNLNFKKLEAGSSNVSIIDNGDSILIDARGLSGGETNIGGNVGGGAEIYKNKNQFQLLFRTLSAGAGISIRQTDNTIGISATAPVFGQGDIKNAVNLGSGIGVFANKNLIDLQFKSLSAFGSTLAVTEIPGTNTITFRTQNVVTNAINEPTSSGAKVFKQKEDNSLIFRRIKAGTGILVEEGGVGSSEIIISSTGLSIAPQQTVNGGASFKNKIINGNFDIWQWKSKAVEALSGTVTLSSVNSITDTNNSTTPRFLADRMSFFAGRALTGGTGTQSATLSCHPLSVSETATMNSRPVACARIILGTRASGSTSPTTLSHRIENIASLAGKQVVFSCWAKSNNIGSTYLNLSYNQFYRNSYPQVNTPTTSVTTFDVSMNWQMLSATFTFPSINQYLWENAWRNEINPEAPTTDSFSQLLLTIPGQAGRIVDITSMQLEEGSVPTPFEIRPYQAELALCQRYFETGNTLQTQNAVEISEGYVDTQFKVTKRTTPVMRTDSRTVLTQGPNTGIFTHQFFDTRPEGFRSYFTPDGTAVSVSPHIINWAASAEF